MDIRELINLKDELQKAYDKEKLEYCKIDNKQIIDDELEDINKEILKVDNLIKIYKNDDMDYIVMKLERLYMMLLSGLDEDNFNSLEEDRIYEIFNKYFPSEWVLKYSLKQKEKLLLDAICNNREIAVRKKNKKN